MAHKIEPLAKPSLSDSEDRIMVALYFDRRLKQILADVIRTHANRADVENAHREVPSGPYINALHDVANVLAPLPETVKEKK